MNDHSSSTTESRESMAEEREAQLLDAFVELADTLVDDYDVVDLMHRLVERCVDLLPVDAAGLMLTDQRGSLQVLASSVERARLLELFQQQANQGPCLEAYHTGEPVFVEDLTSQGTTSRWPVFAPEAARQGYASVHAVPLRLRREVIGAFNLFSATTGPMAAADLRVARALADTATIGILHERALRRSETLTEQLQTALNSRITIEQAKGVLAHAGDLEMEHAFSLLRSYGRDHAIRLSDVATQLATGTLTPATLLDQHTAPER